MLSLLLAALLAATPPAPTTHIPLYPIDLHQQQIQATGNLCYDLSQDKIHVQDVVDDMKLDTKEKQQQLVDTCSLYLQGFVDGIADEQAREQANPHEDHQHPNPDASEIR